MSLGSGIVAAFTDDLIIAPRNNRLLERERELESIESTLATAMKQYVPILTASLLMRGDRKDRKSKSWSSRHTCFPQISSRTFLLNSYARACGESSIMSKIDLTMSFLLRKCSHSTN